MEITPASVWGAGIAVATIFGVIAGYVVGARSSRSRQQIMLQSVKDTNLELLDARAENRELSKFLGEAEKKDRLLTLTLKKLRTGNLEIQVLKKIKEDTDRKHFIEKSRLNLAAVEAKQKAQQAARVAREASFRLRLLERALPESQNNPALEPKSAGQGEAVPLNGVDKHDTTATLEHANQMSDQDLHKIASMQPSKEQVLPPPGNTADFSATAPTGAPTTAHDETTGNTSDQNLHKNGTMNRAN